MSSEHPQSKQGSRYIFDSTLRSIYDGKVPKCLEKHPKNGSF